MWYVYKNIIHFWRRNYLSAWLQMTFEASIQVPDDATAGEIIHLRARANFIDAVPAELDTNSRLVEIIDLTVSYTHCHVCQPRSEGLTLGNITGD